MTQAHEKAIRERLAAQDKAGTLPDDCSIYIGLLENRLTEQRNLNSVMEKRMQDAIDAMNADTAQELSYKHGLRRAEQQNAELLDALKAIKRAFETLPRNRSEGQMVRIAVEAIAKAGDKT